MAWPLLLLDAAFLLAHLLHKMGSVAFAEASFNLTAEGGHGEKFQYLKEAFIAGVLALQAWRHRSGTFAFWALVFAYLFLDDSASIHERGGAAVAAAFQLAPAWGLRAIDLGELVIASIVAASVLLMFAAAARWGRPRFRRASAELLLLLALLAVCGVGFDMLHVMTADAGIAGLGIAEDWGEMLVMSLIAACVVRQLRAV